jgi:tetratricopeptide (TPR) repeat protein
MCCVKRAGYVVLAVVGGAVILGGAGALLGPAWAAAGLVAGPFLALAAIAVVQGLAAPDPADLLRAGRHREGLRLVDEQLPAWRTAARIWPGRFRDALATQLMNRSEALLAAHRDGEALAAAEQGVAIFRSLAAARPGKPSPDLAYALNNLSYPLRAAGRHDEALAAAAEAVGLYRTLAAGRPRKYRYRLANSLGTQAEMLTYAGRPGLALAAASEAAGHYQDMHPADRAASAAARVLFLHGQLLCEASRHREATQSLARAWRLGGRIAEHQPGSDPAVLRTVYHADPAGFLATWHAITGTSPPSWLNQTTPQPDRKEGQTLAVTALAWHGEAARLPSGRRAAAVLSYACLTCPANTRQASALNSTGPERAVHYLLGVLG